MLTLKKERESKRERRKEREREKVNIGSIIRNTKVDMTGWEL